MRKEKYIFAAFVGLLLFTSLSAQNFELLGGFRNYTVKGNYLFIDPIYGYDSRSTGLKEINTFATVAEIGIGLYIPFLKSPKEFSVGLGSDLAVGKGFVGRNNTGSSCFHIPLMTYARWGAGSVKHSKKNFGVGFGVGAEYNGLSVKSNFENYTSYDKIFLTPCLALEVCIESFIGRKVRFQYRSTFAPINDDYHNSEHNIDYGVDVKYHSVTLFIVKDFR